MFDVTVTFIIRDTISGPDEARTVIRNIPPIHLFQNSTCESTHPNIDAGCAPLSLYGHVYVRESGLKPRIPS